MIIKLLFNNVIFDWTKLNLYTIFLIMYKNLIKIFNIFGLCSISWRE